MHNQLIINMTKAATIQHHTNSKGPLIILKLQMSQYVKLLGTVIDVSLSCSLQVNEVCLSTESMFLPSL